MMGVCHLSDALSNAYQREHSAVWQCRYKVDNKWIWATTKETQFDLAVNRVI